jgi:hypothetical protein
VLILILTILPKEFDVYLSLDAIREGTASNVSYSSMGKLQLRGLAVRRAFAGPKLLGKINDFNMFENSGISSPVR